MLKIKTFEEPTLLRTKVLFLDEDNKTIYNFYTNTARVRKEGKVLEESDFMHIPTDMVDDFIKACANFLDQKGIKTKSEHTLEGKLGATERHLADLRQLLKLK